MAALPVIAIFDVGKTNKKILLFDEGLNVRYEKSTRLIETVDEDAFPCEDLAALTRWIMDSLDEALRLPQFDVKAINFAAYGASLVYVGEDGRTIGSLYNYLKPYPPLLSKQFYENYGGESNFSRATASPALGSLNSGLQLYRLKNEQPGVFGKVKYAMHLPHYLSYLFTHKMFTGITSLGCHTGLWDFRNNNYHRWVEEEGILQKLVPIVSSDHVVECGLKGKQMVIGIGLHDSSAALIPYLKTFNESFALISTGTWNITLNPYNDSPLTDPELLEDCLSYLTYQGVAVKASRLFAGQAHQKSVQKIAHHFHLPTEYHQTIAHNATLVQQLKNKFHSVPSSLTSGDFFPYDLLKFNSFEEAYHQLIIELIGLQKKSSALVLQPNTKMLFVDGGFSQNPVFMTLLKDAFPHLEVYAATSPHASALGAAVAIHKPWSKKATPTHLVNFDRV